MSGATGTVFRIARSSGPGQRNARPRAVSSQARGLTGSRLAAAARGATARSVCYPTWVSVSRRAPQPDALDLPDLDKSDDAGEVDVGSFELSLTDDDEASDETKADTFEVDIQVLTDSGSNEAATDLDIGVSDLLDILPEGPEGHDSDPAAGHVELDLHLDTPLEATIRAATPSWVTTVWKICPSCSAKTATATRDPTWSARSCPAPPKANSQGLARRTRANGCCWVARAARYGPAKTYWARPNS